MTKEELEKEAEEYVKQNYCEMCVMADDCKSGCIDCFTVQAYIASAEPREKRIAELIALINAERERQEKCDDVHLRTIAELEKENAELKEYNKYLKRQRQGGIQKQYNKVAIIKQQDDQLTKAKEIIREFVEWATWQGNSKCPSFKSIQNKAEQFISEVEK